MSGAGGCVCTANNLFILILIEMLILFPSFPRQKTFDQKYIMITPFQIKLILSET